jgi:hypothetical protein
MNATTWRIISSRASSALLHRDNGTPVVAGNSHAKALISALTEGGKDPGTPGTLVILQARQALLEESFAPTMNHLRARIATSRDLHVRHTIGGQQDDPGPCHSPIRIRVGTSSPHEFFSFPLRQHDHERANTATGHSVLQQDERNAAHTPSPQAYRITSM